MYRIAIMNYLDRFLLWVFGFAFSATGAQWLHELGHIIMALLSGASIKEVQLWPPWDQHVTAEFSSKLSETLGLSGGFLITVVSFLCLFILLARRRSKLTYLLVFPLFQTVPTSFGDLRALGIPIPFEVSFLFGWLLPVCTFLLLVFYEEKKGMKRHETTIEPFIEGQYKRILEFLVKWTPFGILRRPFEDNKSKRKDYGFVERYALVNFLLSGLLLFFYPTPNPERWWEFAPLLWVGIRIYDLTVYQLKVLLFSEKIRSYPRLVILFLLNYVEIIFWFASFYRFMNGFFETRGANLDSLFGSLNFSFHTMTTFGYTTISPLEGNLGHVLTLIQSAIGVFMALLILARFMNIRTPSEILDTSKNNEAVS